MLVELLCGLLMVYGVTYRNFYTVFKDVYLLPVCAQTYVHSTVTAST